MAGRILRAPDRSVASFDSALATVTVLAAALHGHDLPRLGKGPAAAGAFPATTLLPGPVRRHAYARAGALESVPADQLADVDLESVAQLISDRYPQRRYPAVLIGAANGGITHLAAAAQLPWLPQTVLVPVRYPDNDPDRPDHALAWGARTAKPLLDANPGIELHHMHDPNQDRLMLQQMAYFRCKWSILPDPYRAFPEQRLQPGAPVVIVGGRTALAGHSCLTAPRVPARRLRRHVRRRLRSQPPCAGDRRGHCRGRVGHDARIRVGRPRLGPHERPPGDRHRGP